MYEDFFWLLYKLSSCPNCCWSPRRSIRILLFSKPMANLISWVLSLVLSFLPFSGTLFHLPSFSGSPGFPLATDYKYAYSTLYSTLLYSTLPTLRNYPISWFSVTIKFMKSVVHSYALSSSFLVAIWVLSPQLCRNVPLKDSNVFETDFYQSSGFSSLPSPLYSIYSI